MLMPRAVDVVRFGDFELDVRAYELRHHGHPVRLERRPMDLLIFLVERHGELVTHTDIVDQLWGKDVFIEVEPAVNTAIKKIRRALNDPSDAPVFLETVPGKGYRFVGTVTPVSAAGSTASAAPRNLAAATTPSGSGVRLPRAWRWLAAGAALLAVGILGWQRWSGVRGSTAEPMRLVPLTTLRGMERGATFSPDGRQVAFTWSGEREDNWDIHVQVIGSPDVRWLTEHPDRDLAPKWSSDGRQIVYLRQEPSGEVEYLRVMSALGGSDRQISALNILPGYSWAPDDRWIAVGVVNQAGAAGGIYLLPVDGGEPRQLTKAPAGGIDWMTAFSPDGRRLAYGSCASFMSNCHVQVVTLDAGFGVVGQARRLTAAPVPTIRGVTWSRDGESVIYGAMSETSNDLWRARLTGETRPQRIEIAGTNAVFPAAVRSADGLAFTRGIIDEDVFAVREGRPPRPVTPSSLFDGHPQFSPDGRKIAFCSDRSTSATEIWMADADGTHPEQITRGPGRFQCFPAWSPDGRAVAFESRDTSGASQIYSIDVNLHQPKQLTTGKGDRKLPSWSRDGAWIYFSWDEGAGRDIWRVRRSGGVPERVTTGGSGLAAAESADGRTLYYLAASAARRHEPTDAALLALPVGSSQPRGIIACVRGTAFSIGDKGISYVPCRSASDGPGVPVRVLDLASGTSRPVIRLDGYEHRIPSSFSASPDSRTFLYNRGVNRGEDLLLIENFR